MREASTFKNLDFPTKTVLVQVAHRYFKEVLVFQYISLARPLPASIFKTQHEMAGCWSGIRYRVVFPRTVPFVRNYLSVQVVPVVFHFITLCWHGRWLHTNLNRVYSYRPARDHCNGTNKSKNQLSPDLFPFGTQYSLYRVCCAQHSLELQR